MLENYISHVHIENFRSLANVDVDLLPLTVLVGANGSGKSNFIDALRFVRDSLTRTPDGAMTSRGGTSQIAYKSLRARNASIQFSLLANIDAKNYEYGFHLAAREDNFEIEDTHVLYERLSIDGTKYLEKDDAVWKIAPEGISTSTLLAGLALYSLSERGNIQPFYNLITNQRYYMLYPDALRSESRSQRRYIRALVFDEYGSNIEGALGFFLESQERAQDLRNSLTAIVPHIVSVQEKYNVDRYEVYIGHSNGIRLRLYQESDGTLRIIALLLALYGERSSSSLIAIEEPELAVHPGALGVLVDVIEEAALSTQVIITTHSPDLIARFRAKNLRIVEWTDEGTKIGPLNERQRDVIEKQLFGAGDLLRIEGLSRSSE